MKKGFTLAEVLITLGIVGIVAVLTIPGVMKNYQNRLYTAQLEKVYAQISDAAQALMNDEHVDNFYETSASGFVVCTNTGICKGGLANFLSNYFKVIKDNCAGSDEPCISDSATFYKTVNGANVAGGMAPADYCIQTISGASICGFHNGTNHCTSLVVDVNGMALPNVAGRDIFSMDIRQNGSIADFGSACLNTNAGTTAENCMKGSTDSLYEASAGCLNSVMQAGWKMEY